MNLSGTISALKNISQWKETEASIKIIIAIKKSDEKKKLIVYTSNFVCVYISKSISGFK